MSAAEPETPYFTLRPAAVTARMRDFRAAFPGSLLRYPVKTNPHPAVLAAVLASAGGYEVASPAELDAVLAAGAGPETILYGAPVKSPSAIRYAAAKGVSSFVADASAEISKLASLVPGRAVWVRVAVDDPSTLIPLGSKFGADSEDAPALLEQAESLGLRPGALMFHIGSQCTDASGWARGIKVAAEVLRRTSISSRPPLIDIGGGFPWQYDDKPVPALCEIAAECCAALDSERLGQRLVLEPGRSLVAGAADLTVTVIGRRRRGRDEWLFLDAGIWHGLSEAALPGHPLRYPVRLAGRTPVSGQTEYYTLAGHTCDSLDVIGRRYRLPACVHDGDRLVFGSVGAYGNCLTTPFNGFPPPTELVLGRPSAEADDSRETGSRPRAGRVT